MELKEFDTGVLAMALAHTCAETKFCPASKILDCPLKRIPKSCKQITADDWEKKLEPANENGND